MLTWNLRHLSQHHRHRLSFFSVHLLTLNWNTPKFHLYTRWFSYVAIQSRCRILWQNPEARVLARDLRFLSQHYRRGIYFFLYFFYIIILIILPNFSFTQAVFDAQQWKSRIGAHGRALSLGHSCVIEHVSVCVTGMELLVFFVSLLKACMVLPILSFTEDDLAAWQYKFCIGICDRTLSLGCSHAI